MHGCSAHMCAWWPWRPTEGTRRPGNSVVNLHTWVLGDEHPTPSRTISALNCQAIPPAWGLSILTLISWAIYPNIQRGYISPCIFPPGTVWHKHGLLFIPRLGFMKNCVNISNPQAYCIQICAQCHYWPWDLAFTFGSLAPTSAHLYSPCLVCSIASDAGVFYRLLTLWAFQKNKGIMALRKQNAHPSPLHSRCLSSGYFSASLKWEQEEEINCYLRIRPWETWRDR